jgi:aryl-alcohol dehydrogenase-like predicted oxidoreductase
MDSPPRLSDVPHVHGLAQGPPLPNSTRVRSAAAEPPIAPADAAIRWIAAHSALSAGAGDGLILGATSAPQLVQTLAAAVAAEPLPQAVLEALDASWTDCATDSPDYFR